MAIHQNLKQRFLEQPKKIISLLRWSIEQLAQDITLPTNWKDHQLKGSMRRYYECHVGDVIVNNEQIGE